MSRPTPPEDENSLPPAPSVFPTVSADLGPGNEAALRAMLAHWQAEKSQGRDVPVTALSQHRPELAAELARRIEALRRAGDLSATPETAASAGGPTPARSAPPAPLPSLPGYEVLATLGRGGMGVVYRARQTKLDRVVALKMILSGAHAGPADLARFRTEAEAIARLQHPNIVQIYEVGEQDGLPFFSLEFCGGGSLDAKLSGTPLPPKDAAALVETLARGMQAAHDKGVIHRDLKPANVLLTEDGTPKITDFGLAKKLDEAGQTQSGAVMGTPSYMAPEQASGKSSAIGPASDIYALGAVLYQCLTGRPPFKAATVIDTIRQVVHDEPVPPARLQPRTPRDLETICLKCLQKEPHKRYGTAAELADDLRRFALGQPIRARAVGRLERAAKFARRNPVLTAMTAAVALALLAATAVSTGAFLLTRGALGREREANGKTRQAQRDRALAQVDALLSAEPAAVPAILGDLEARRADVDSRLRELAAEEDLPENQRTRVRLALLAEDSGQVAPLRDALLGARPQELLLLRDALQPYKDRLTVGLWQAAGDAAAPADRRFRAACALAAFDPAGDGWAKIAPDVTAALVGQDPLLLGDWVEALRPARAALLDPLTRLFRAPDRPDSAYVATTILGNYLSDRPEQLADLLLDADAQQYAALLPRLRGQDAALAPLQKEVDKALAPDWKDAPPDPAWTATDPALTAKIEAAGGLVADRFALCQAMALDDFLKVAEGLRPSGYRPTRLRPYAAGNGVAVAALWRRDGLAWQMAQGLSADDLRKQDQTERGKGYLPIDVAGYLLPGGKRSGAERYAGLWVESSARASEVKLLVGLAPAEYGAATATFPVPNYLRPVAAHSMLAPDGTYRSSSVWWRSDHPPALTWFGGDGEPSYEAWLTPSYIQADVCVGRQPPPPPGLSPYASLLAEFPAVAQLLPQLTGPTIQHMSAGMIALGLGRDKDAVTELTAAIQALPVFPLPYGFRAMAQARLGNANEARNDLALSRKYLDASVALYQKMGTNISASTRLAGPWQAYTDFVASAYLGDDVSAARRAEAVWQQHRDDGVSLFVLGRAYAVASRVVPQAGAKPPATNDDRAARARSYAARAVALFEQAASRGFLNHWWEWQACADLDPIRDDPTFKALLARLHLERNYSAVWHTATPDVEGQESHGLPPDEHLARCRELAAQGYRPTAICVAAVDDGPLATASVWQRPVVTAAARDALARRQANALLALFHLGQPEPIWPRLRASADNRLRSYLIERLAAPPDDPTQLTARLRDETDGGAWRALVLALGSATDAALPAADRDRAAADLLEHYRNDPDPGSHSAADWLLRRWKKADPLSAADRQLASDQPQGERRWYVNHHGDTLAVIPGPVRFWMGSPCSEAGRDASEVAHPVQIGRTFAVATRPVTVEQFLRFRPDHTYGEWLSPTRDGPIIEVNWYDAAAYCRWLSEQEKVPEDQMCFPPIAQIGPAMVLPDDYLKRTGYRLPTEAEWEYACRAGAATSRPYGDDLRLLPAYAWAPDGAHLHAHPVGQLKPNDLGLFDTLGNVGQWCIDPYRLYPLAPAGIVLDDRPPGEADTQRMTRGDSFRILADQLRCATRFVGAANTRYQGTGFRVARTLPAPKNTGRFPGDLANYSETLRLGAK